MSTEERKNEELTNDQIISLMDIYLNEWEHRDGLLWSQVFRCFYATLIVTILPNAAAFVGIELPQINAKMFPVIGIVMSLVFLYVGLGYAMRLQASGKTYAKVMKLLGNEKYQRISIKNRKEIKMGFIFSPPIAHVLVITMFLALVAIAVLLLVI